MALLGPDGRPAPGWPVRLVDAIGCSKPALLPDGSVRALCAEEDRDAVVYALDARGDTMPGWPIRLADGNCYSDLLTVGDGSVRIVCWRRSASHAGAPSHVVFGLDAQGNTMPGWPVIPPPEADTDEAYHEQRVVGDRLVLVAGDWFERDRGYRDWLVTFDKDGVVRSGVHVPAADPWMVGLGPDGIAYLVDELPESYSATAARITAFDLAGVRSGWPVSLGGMASTPAFGPNGRIYVTVGTGNRSTVVVLDRGGKSISDASPVLEIATAGLGVDCSAGAPHSPIVARDGTTFVDSTIDTAIYALDPSLDVREGWAYTQPQGSPADECAGAEGICCSFPLATPRAVGPGGTLYLALQPETSAVGGGITMIGRKGRVRPGWPVVLRRPGAMFASVVVGADGTAYALAIEPESGGRTSATVLGIAPDGSVRYRTALADP